MINPIEIKQQCEKWWKNVLVATLKKEPFFSKEIQRIGKPTVKYITENYIAFAKETNLIVKNSKNENPTKKGYSLVFKEIKYTKIGNQRIIDKIKIDTLEDYLKITKKEKECSIFLENVEVINKELPILKEWVIQNPLKLISHNTWNNTLKVCHYFLENPQPNLYIRELPISVHTKYIIENRFIIESLLDFLIADYTNPIIIKAKNEREFYIKFNLLYDEHQIRMRFLDSDFAINNLTEITLPISDFQKLDNQAKFVFITENSKNFLTLPKLKNTIALWSGGGFSVSYLKKIEWLKGKQFFYWGDIDAHGFHILNQFRTYFPATISVMMNQETLSNFENHITEGKQTIPYHLPNLTPIEIELYHYLQKNNLRLEQEKIIHSFAEQEIEKIYTSF